MQPGPADDDEHLPTFTAKDVAKNNGRDGSPIWMSYGGYVYDVTNFIPNHPGGSEKILLAAGSSVEQYWHVYRQHFASDLPLKHLEKMRIGKLHDADQQRVDDEMERIAELEKDPYALEPERHPQLIVHSDQPANMETPSGELISSYITPSEVCRLFERFENATALWHLLPILRVFDLLPAYIGYFPSTNSSFTSAVIIQSHI